MYPKDTQCTDSEIIHDPIVTVVDGIKGIANDIKEVVSCVNEMKNNFTDMVTNISVSKLLFSEKENSEKPKDTLLKSEEINSFQDYSAIFICKDAKQLLKILPERGFEYYEEQNLIMCILCNQSSTPNVKVWENKVGFFTFDLSSYMLEVEKEPNKQPRVFLNLKKKTYNT